MRLVVLWFVLALGACTDRSYTPTMPEALDVGTKRTIYAASIRKQEANGNFGFRRSEQLNLLELTVSIPPTHQPGDLKFGYANPKPEKQFAIAGRHTFDSPDAFQNRIREDLSRLPPNQREVTIFVHGYNATQAETAYRAAQISYDLEATTPTIIYSWPSRGQISGYVYDNDSMLFARDGLEKLLRFSRDSGSTRIVIVAHSMGSALTMETLRQIEIKEPGWAARSLSGVVLISPDISVEVFRKQVERIEKLPQPFVIFVSEKDTALSISAFLRGDRNQAQLGNLKYAYQVSDLPVAIIDTTPFSDEAGSGHLVAVTSPTMLSILNRAGGVANSFDAELHRLRTQLAGNATNFGKAEKITFVPPSEQGR
jgi:esterase/lipase superfamily enzyme